MSGTRHLGRPVARGPGDPLTWWNGGFSPPLHLPVTRNQPGPHPAPGPSGRTSRNPTAESTPTMNFLATLLTSVAVALLEGLIVHAAKTAYQRMSRTRAA
ncbi:hypothetical protein GCM10020366_31040 [Saccharopolyspora gregorii]|uniref:Uncharacterized protein n=1 Tax=Saccharopolyspora gregorii TaxID=33914 RepID=A0ABP6RQ94_9PSEU